MPRSLARLPSNTCSTFVLGSIEPIWCGWSSFSSPNIITNNLTEHMMQSITVRAITSITMKETEPKQMCPNTVLVDEHANADATHEEPVEEVLDVLLGLAVNSVRLLHLKDALLNEKQHAKHVRSSFCSHLLIASN